MAWRRPLAKDKNLKLVPQAEKAEGKSISLGKDVSRRPKQRRRHILAISFLLCVLFPGLITAGYYAFVATDRYVSGSGFSVRGMDLGAGGDFIGAMTGLASVGTTTSDSYILLQYLQSRDLVERLQQDFPLRDHYSAEAIDPLSRLRAGADIEEVVDYWRTRVNTTYDSTSGIVSYEIEAFSPDAALQIANLVLGYGRDLVNELSGRAREDAVAYAQGEVQRAESRLRLALDSLRGFRESEMAIDPAGAAQIQMQLIGGLESQLADVRARISAIEGSVDADAPSMRTLRRQAEALETQIAAQRAEIGTREDGSPGSALSGQLATYETLEIERNFAQQAYASALSSLETARMEADRQQRYLAVFSAPMVPEHAIYPRRVLNTILAFLGLGLIWGIGALIVYAVRDHLS